MHAIALLLVLLAPAEPDVVQVIRNGVAAGKAQDDKGWKYTWRQDYEQTDIDKNGKVFGKKLMTFDMIMLEGENYQKLILIDGKPLDDKLQKKVDKELEEERGRRHSQHSSLRTLRKSWAMSTLPDLEPLFDNKLAGEDTVGGRPAWRVESTPKASHKPANKTEEQIMGARRTTWFDREEGFEIKHEIEFIRPVEGNQPGTRYVVEWAKIGDAWLPSQEFHKVEFKALGMIHAWGEHRFRFYDYKRFEVESKITVQ
jgi:hypothetical protein